MSFAIPTPSQFTALTDEDLEVDGGVAPAVLIGWGIVVGTITAIGVASDAINGIYDLCTGWGNYEGTTPHVTSTIYYPTE